MYIPRASGELQHQLQVLVAIRKNVPLAPAVIKKTAYESVQYLLHDGRTAVCLCEALRTAWRQHANLERSRQDWQGPLHWCFRRPKVSLAPAVIKMAGRLCCNSIFLQDVVEPGGPWMSGACLSRAPCLHFQFAGLVTGPFTGPSLLPCRVLQDDNKPLGLRWSCAQSSYELRPSTLRTGAR